MSRPVSLLFYYFIFFSASFFAAWIAAVDIREEKTYLVRLGGGRLRIRYAQLLKWLCLLAVPVLAASFRYGIGTDYPTYSLIYDAIADADISGMAVFSRPTELLSNLLYKLADRVFHDFHGWLFFTSLITILGACVAIQKYRDSSDVFLMTFSFFSLLYSPSYNIVRQIMAGSIVFLGLRYITERKPVKYYLTILTAFFLHTSAVFTAFFYFLNVKKGKYAKFKLLALFAACAAIPLVFSRVFAVFTSLSAFQSYGTVYSSRYGFLHVSDILFRLPLAAVILFFRRPLERNDDDCRFYELLFFMEFVSLFITAYNKWLYRMLYYCVPGEIVLVSRLPKCFDRKSRLFIRLGIVVYYILFFYVNNYYRGVDEIFPYISIFN